VPRRPDLIVDQHPAGWHSSGQSVQVFYIAHGNPWESYRTAASISATRGQRRERAAQNTTPDEDDQDLQSPCSFGDGTGSGRRAEGSSFAKIAGPALEAG